MDEALQRIIQAELDGCRKVHDHLVSLQGEIAGIVQAFRRCFNEGGKLLICGNGGSAADSQHLAAEFVCRFRRNRAALPAVALTTDSSALTAIGNDYAFDEVFVRQVEALGRPGDVLVAISTSGRSPNVLKAVAAARKKRMTTIGFTGGAGPELAKIVDHALVVPNTETARIQECHLASYHIICRSVEDLLFPENGAPAPSSPAR